MFVNLIFCLIFKFIFEIMMQSQENFHSMTDEVQKLLTANAVLVATVAALDGEFTRFKAKRLELVDNYIRQQQAIKGATKQKRLDRAAAIQEAVQVAGNVYVYAVQANDQLLAENMSFRDTTFKKQRDTEILAKIRWVHTQAVALLPLMGSFGNTVASLAHFQQVIDTYADSVSGPRNVNVEKKTATRDIKLNIEELRGILNNIDRLMYNFSVSHPQFLSDYQNAREIIDYGHRRTRLGLFVELEDGVDSAGVVVVITKGTKSYTEVVRSADHTALFDSVLAGTYNVSIHHVGYQPYTGTVLVRSGAHNTGSAKLML